MELRSKEQLKQNYLDTTYSVFLNDDKFDINIGKAIPVEINQLLDNKNKTAVIITAWNPRSQALSLKENIKRNHDLLRSLSNVRYSVFEAHGQGNDASWPAEVSFFVTDITNEEAEKLAIEYEQYAYVWIEKGKEVSLKFTQIWYD